MRAPGCDVLLGGEAGQGLVTAGDTLARILSRAGYEIVVTQSYQSRIRGGHNTYAIRAGVSGIHAPRESFDLAICLDRETAALDAARLRPGGVLLEAEADGPASAEGTAGVGSPSRAGGPVGVGSPSRAGGPVSFDRIAIPFARLGGARLANLTVLGVIAYLLGLDSELAAATAAEMLRDHPSLAAHARRMIPAASDWAARQPSARAAAGRLRLPPSTPRARLLLDGNQAVALGAVSAGVRFCAYYPMTPATGIPLTLAAHAERLGLVVEQAEDEIAAINMALGASFAGAPALVATSGGGFALMVEGVSLAGMTETPIVIVVGQRPGPATGLPTRTEQADLEFVLHAGHGEFPRAVFAPGGVEDGFHLARRACDLAERSQGPVFLLTDQFFADSLHAVEPFSVEALPEVRPGEAQGAPAAPAAAPAVYRRHALTESGISPRRLPGRGTDLVVTDSDEHTEDGHLTEDLGVRAQMVAKRLRKEAGLRAAVVAPVYEGDPRPELLLVGWGSTLGALREAATDLRAQGRRAACLHFSQVWPLAPAQFLPRLQSAETVIAVEGNAGGQFARLIRRETGFEIPRRVLRFDGLPITPEYILGALASGS